MAYSTLPGDATPIGVDSQTLVRHSYDHEATGKVDVAILDMLRAIYQQNVETLHKLQSDRQTLTTPRKVWAGGDTTNQEAKPEEKPYKGYDSGRGHP